MEARRCSIVAFSCLGLVWGMLVLTTLQFTEASNINRRIGIQFLSFRYKTNGMLPDGTCCDGLSGQGGQCAVDSCDTAFTFCVTHQSNGSACDSFFETTPLINNNTVSTFGKKIDPNNPNSTVSLITIPISTMEPIEVLVGVKEVSESAPGMVTGSVELANFSMLLNTTHLFTTHPDWETFDFQNNIISLSLNATSFCSMHNYGSFCNISCSDKGKHYTCQTDGSKICEQGYEGPQCNNVINLCVSGPCQNQGVCHKRVNDFACTCAQNYTGKTCDTQLPGPSQIPPKNGARTGSSSGGTTIGAIVGPVVAVLLLLVLALLLALWYRRKRKRTVKPEEEQADGDSPDEKENGVVDTEKPEKAMAPLATEASTKEAEEAVIRGWIPRDDQCGSW